MAFNVPTYDTDNFSFGPGVLYVGAAGSTPTLDVGAVRAGAEFAVSRERLEVFQGSPRSLVKQYIVQENAQLTVTGIEWDVDKLTYVLGSGVTTSTAAQDTYAFGGDLNISESAVKFVHETPAGHTIELYIWKAQGTGEITINFGDDLHEFPYVFAALESTTDWNSVALASNQRLFKIVRKKQ